MRLLVLFAPLLLLVLAVVVTVAVRRARALDASASLPLGEAWERPLRRALRARARFHEIVRNTSPGPLRDRFEDLTVWIDAATAEATRVARIGSAIEPSEALAASAATRLDELVGTLERSVLAAAELALGSATGDRAVLDRELSALQAAVEEIRRTHPS